MDEWGRDMDRMEEEKETARRHTGVNDRDIKEMERSRNEATKWSKTEFHGTV